MDKKIVLMILGVLLISSFAFADLRDRIIIGGGGTRIRPILPPTIVEATIDADTRQFLIDNGVEDYNKSQIKCDTSTCFMEVSSPGNFDFFVRTARKFRSPKCLPDLLDANKLYCSGYEWLDKDADRLGIELDRLADRKLQEYIIEVQEPQVEITSIRGVQRVDLIGEIIGGGGGIIRDGGGIIGGIIQGVTDTINGLLGGN